MASGLKKTTSSVGFKPAKLITGKRWYAEFYSLNPESGKLHRKRVSVPRIKSKTERKRYAAEMVAQLNEDLYAGWNPFFMLGDPKEYAGFHDVCHEYCAYILRLQDDGIIRPKTYNGYISYMNIFLGWCDSLHKPLKFVCQLKKQVIIDFLQFIWIRQQKSARTRDNYLMWLRTFCSWLIENGYAPDDPTSSLTMLVGRRKYEKNRTVISKEKMMDIRHYLEESNKHFLLACYVIYYCFIRPKEMSHIQLKDISLSSGTIRISSVWSKNRKDQVVTLPDVVAKLMIDLGVFSNDYEDYLFSSGFRPGRSYRSGKSFGDYWTGHVKKDLNLPDEYKFYSLKDTGITDLIRDNTDLISVRDQARHYSLQMTDIYTPMEQKTANESIRHHESYF